MKQTINLNSLHIGSMIKEIAHNKGISALQIADILHRYQQNASKIYQRHDMDIADIILISYLLEYNFLKIISEKYLSHLPFTIENNLKPECYRIEWNTQNELFSVIGDIGKDDTLQKINIGQHIRKFAQKKGWSEQDVAKLLECSQTTVNFLYRYKSLKIKRLIQISDTLNHNFIAEAYLSRMFIISPLNMFNYCAATITQRQTYDENPYNKHF